jgi:hypothetical protein
MSTEPYPEVNMDESGIGPQQPQQHGPEWPKKIRTLTATELDRLTIDSAGRFYWDGKLVNYEPPNAPKPAAEKPAEPPARPPSDAPEHDPYSFESKPAEPAEPTEHAEHTVAGETERTEEAQIHPVAHRSDRFHELDDVRTVEHHAVHHHDMAAEITDAYVAPSIQIPDRIRVSMTFWQSLGAFIVVLCLMVGTLGVAAFGFIAAHDWGCRTGLIKVYCAPAPGSRPIARPDIPA